jgi:hypothetical protein
MMRCGRLDGKCDLHAFEAWLVICLLLEHRSKGVGDRASGSIFPCIGV